MSKEGIIDIYRDTQLAEPQLNSQSILLGLIAGGQEKEEVLQKIVFYLESNPYIQASFLKTLFQCLGEEGDSKITNRRDAALEILTDTKDGEIRLTQAITPIVKNNLTVVYEAYIAAVEQQTEDNDPISGSIFALLKAGKAIAPLIRSDNQRNGTIIGAWQSVAKKFPEKDQRSYIYLQIKEIKYYYSSFPELDAKVKELRDQHLTIPRIMMATGKTRSQINESLRRLNAAGKISKYNPGKNKSPGSDI